MPDRGEMNCGLLYYVEPLRLLIMGQVREKHSLSPYVAIRVDNFLLSTRLKCPRFNILLDIVIEFW